MRSIVAADCAFNQAALRPAYPIKCLYEHAENAGTRKRRKRSKPSHCAWPIREQYRPRVDGALARTFWRVCSVGRVRSRVRPVDAADVAAGPNALRGSGPNRSHALGSAL